MDEATGAVAGNPATDASVTEILKSITNKSRAAGARDHAEAARIEDLEVIVQWSESQVSPTVDWSQTEITDTTRLLTIAKHLSMRAFMAAAFTLWTR